MALVLPKTNALVVIMATISFPLYHNLHWLLFYNNIEIIYKRRQAIIVQVGGYGWVWSLGATPTNAKVYMCYLYYLKSQKINITLSLPFSTCYDDVSFIVEQGTEYIFVMALKDLVTLACEGVP